ncbi:hydroxyisourate hydrolase [uncultured Bacteroides sp.]|uniref:hydroxyisourate hydrolase n=1 Tax=uncultured Bacteroides sp. TaxID=162156 RepID=UPI0026044F44|nr:hydroxyisourate hydrolase [uncultured Bacteroides sp.]
MKKRFLFFVATALISALTAFGQTKEYQLSSHILDINQGKPATGVKITLEKQDKDDHWTVIDEKTTNPDGRVKDFLERDGNDHKGIYRLTYHVAPYFEAQKQSTFYPFIEVVFEIKDNNHYHVPITLSPYGYSTYRGS